VFDNLAKNMLGMAYISHGSPGMPTILDYGIQFSTGKDQPDQKA